MAEGSHPFPFRTRPLRPPALMVLQGRLGGRVGRCRDFFVSTYRASGFDPEAFRVSGRTIPPTIVAPASRVPARGERIDDVHTVGDEVGLEPHSLRQPGGEDARLVPRTHAIHVDDDVSNPGLAEPGRRIGRRPTVCEEAETDDSRCEERPTRV